MIVIIFPEMFDNFTQQTKLMSELQLTTLLSRKIEWIIHSIYGVKKFHSSSESHSILAPVEWKFTTQRVESRPVHSIFTPKEVITDDVTPHGVTSVTNRVKIHSIFF